MIRFNLRFNRRVLAVGLWMALIGVSAAELTPEQKRRGIAIRQLITQAHQQYIQRQLSESAATLQEAAEGINQLIESGTPELYDALGPMMSQMRRVHASLELEGVPLPPLILLPRPASAAPAPLGSSEPMVSPATKPAEPIKPATAAKSRRRPARRPDPPTPPPASADAVSFTSVVAPILTSRCGQCHVRDSKGGFQMTSYASLMKGPPEGVVVFPGDVIASRLIETIETGDMPRGGGKVAAEELLQLKAWVLQGAKFDGPDPTATLAAASTAPAGATPMPATPEVQRATGNETVSFASDVAPLLTEHCSGCHVDAMQARGGLQMNTFAQLLRGGDSGAIVTPGDGEASLLVRKLRGSEGNRMPAGGRPALPDQSIALISKWIDEGAKLDGANENQPLTVMSQLAWVAQATPEQVSERRAKLAQDHLTLANAAGAAVAHVATEHFNVIGTAGQGTLEMVAQQAEQMLRQTRTLVSGAPGEAYFRGRATIFVLPRRYDYSEFAKMVESRGIPAEWESHWQSDGVNAYVALVATDSEEPEVIAKRLLPPLTALAVATRGADVPRWFAEGVGVALAARQRGMLDRDARRKMEAEIQQATAAMGDAKRFLEGKLTAEQVDRIGAAVVASMIDRTRQRQFDALLRELDAGTAFEPAFTKAFGVPVAEYLDAWLGWVRGS